MSDDLEILRDFIHESKITIRDSTVLLDKVEGEMVQAKKLKDYGNLVDRIMGTAKSIGTLTDPDHAIHLVGDYAALCKAVGYKASQIDDNEQFFNICVALLQDATETLDGLLDNLDKGRDELRKSFSNTFFERLRWVSSKFSTDYNESVGTGGSGQKKLEQGEIDNLLKKMGF